MKITKYIKGDGLATRIFPWIQRYTIPACIVGGLVGLVTINLWRKNRTGELKGAK